ncbi:MAG: transposase, partial [Candidatus Korarchaeota archaeon]
MSFPVSGRLRGSGLSASGYMWRGLSLRRVAGILCELGFQVSHESVRDWFHRAGEAFSLVDRRRRGPIAVDETVIRNLVRRAYLWAAREVGTGEVMAVQVSRGRGIAECIRFLEGSGL